MPRLIMIALLFVVSACADEIQKERVADGGLLQSVQRADNALEISDDVHADYLGYVQELGADRDGAFAVSLDGTHAGYFVCGAVSECYAEQHALRACSGYSNTWRCVLMARRDVKKRPIDVIPTLVPLQAGDPILAQRLDDGDLRQRLSGASLKGRYLNDARWAEYLAPDGTVLGRSDALGSYRGIWKIEGDRLCLTYFTTGDRCTRLSLVGGKVYFIVGGSQGAQRVATFRDVRLVAGNALAAP